MSQNKRNARKYVDNKRNDKKQDYSEKEFSKKDTKGQNDLSWHAKSDTLLVEAASIPWSWATGRPITLGGAYDTAPDVTFKYTVPGILAVRTVLTPGAGIAKSDALNIAAQALYTDIRRMLKSANAYESSDVMIYMTAVGEVMAYIGWLTRLYATTMLYSYRNSYMPDELIRIQGVDPEDLHNHALEFLSRANQLIAKASQIYIPKGFDYLKRCRWEYANYYSEGDSIKDQIYMFTPGMFRQFKMNPSDDYKGCLYPTIKIDKNSNLTVAELLVVLEEMLDALIGDSDFANIAGDLMNRYGEGGVMTFSLIPQDAVMQIISGPAAYEILEQIQNSRALRAVRNAWVGATVDGTGDPNMFWVMQGKGENQYLRVNTMVTEDTHTTAQRVAFVCDAINTLLTVHENPNPAKTMLITRFTNMIRGVEDAVSEVSYWIEAAADLLIGYDFVTLNPDGTRALNSFTSCVDDASAVFVHALLKLKPFHYQPTFYINDETKLITVCTAADIVAPITEVQLMDINRVDLMSLFAVPDIGKVTG